MTTGEALDLITSVLSAVKRLLLDNRGEVTDADLIALGASHQATVGWLPALCRWPRASLA
jgi:hypothetical protein